MLSWQGCQNMWTTFLNILHRDGVLWVRWSCDVHQTVTTTLARGLWIHGAGWPEASWSPGHRSQSARRPASISRESVRSFTWILLCPNPLVLSDTDDLTERTWTRKCGLECNLRAGPMTPRRQGRRSGRCWRTVTTRRSRDLRRKKTTQCSWPPKRTRTTEVAKNKKAKYILRYTKISFQKQKI